MKIPTSKGNRANRSLPALMAVGGSLAAMPASALELGELTLQSHLGQPLRASIAFALGPNEQIAENCVALRRGPSVSGLPNAGAATVNVSNGVIFLAGKTPLREPMISAHLVINCPYAPNLSREYLAFLDPAIPAYQQQAATPPAVRPRGDQPVVRPIQEAVVRTRPAPATESRATAAARSQDVAPTSRPAALERRVPQSTVATDSYRVQPGDSLSEIVARIDDRSLGLWAAVDAVFAANPHAFIDNDRNKLKAGSVLSIPDLGGSGARVAVASAAPAASSPVVDTAPAVTSESGPVEPQADTFAASEPTSANATSSGAADVDEILGDGDAGAATESNVLLDADIEAPLTTSQSPNQAAQVITMPVADNSGAATPSWLLWLAGSGIALILALLLFGRRLRGEPELAPIAEKSVLPHERLGNDPAEAIGVEETVPPVVDATEAQADDEPTEENLALDARVVADSDLDNTAPNELADFSYDATAEVDFELPFEPEPTVKPDTAMLPALKTDEVTILESEVLPEDDDDEMSIVIEDTSDVPSLEDTTAQHLAAETDDTFDDNDATMIESAASIGDTIVDIDLETLEQDYEDELTATQAMNAEMAKAAEQLQTDLDGDATREMPASEDETREMPVDGEETREMAVDGDETREMAADGGQTTEMPKATVTELDVTGNQEPLVDEARTEDTDLTETMPANDDDTTEMPIDSGKKRRAKK